MKGNVNPAPAAGGKKGKPVAQPAVPAPSGKVRRATAHNGDMKFDGGIPSFDAGGKKGTKG